MTTTDGRESGGSEPHVFATAAGQYMVKVANNPQGSRVLLNELLAGLCMDWLGVHHPDPAIVEIPEEVITSSPQAKFQSGVPLAHGLAFGSRLWQSEPQSAVDAGLIIDLENIAATLAFDTWVPNGDGRQYRVRPSGDDPSRYDYIPVDQGHSFGHNWTVDSLSLVAASVAVPAELVPLASGHLRPFVLRLREFNEETADWLVQQIPDAWWDPDERTAARDLLATRASAAADAIDQHYPPEAPTEVNP